MEAEAIFEIEEARNAEEWQDVEYQPIRDTGEGIAYRQQLVQRMTD